MARGLARLTVDELEAELRRRTRLLDRLNRRRAAIQRRVDSLDDQIQSSGGSFSG